MELVFHTTSGALWSGPPSTYGLCGHNSTNRTEGLLVLNILLIKGDDPPILREKTVSSSLNVRCNP